MRTSITQTTIICDACQSKIIYPLGVEMQPTPTPEFFTHINLDLCSRCAINVLQLAIKNRNLSDADINELIDEFKLSHKSHYPVIVPL